MWGHLVEERYRDSSEYSLDIGWTGRWGVGLWCPSPCCADQSLQLPLGHSLVGPSCCHFILWLESQWKVNVPNQLVRMREQMAGSAPPQREQCQGKRGGRGGRAREMSHGTSSRK